MITEIEVEENSYFQKLFAEYECNELIPWQASESGDDLPIRICGEVLGFPELRVIRNYRIMVKFSDLGMHLTVELDPCNYWLHVRRQQESVSPKMDPFRREGLSPAYLADLESLVNMAETYFVRQESLNASELAEFAQTTLASFNESQIKMEKRGFTKFLNSMKPKSKCQMQAIEGGRSAQCSFSLNRELEIGSQFLNDQDLRTFRGDLCLTIPHDVSNPEVLILVDPDNSHFVHTNEDLVLFPPFWQMVRKVANSVKSLSGHYPVALTINFGGWETKISKSKSGLEQCHGHAHLLLPLDFANKLGLHNGNNLHTIPNLYREENCNELRRSRYDYSKSIVVPVMQKREADEKHADLLRKNDELLKKLDEIMSRLNLGRPST